MSKFTGNQAERLNETAPSAADGAKRRPGRPYKDGAVKRTDRRVNFFIKRAIYDYWSERNEQTGETMTGLVNRLLYEEMERLKVNGHR